MLMYICLNITSNENALKAVELLSKVGDVVGFRSFVKNLKALNDDGISCSKPLPVENYR